MPSGNGACLPSPQEDGGIVGLLYSILFPLSRKNAKRTFFSKRRKIFSALPQKNLLFPLDNRSPLGYTIASKKYETKKGVLMMKYVCELCGWEYDEAAGDPENDIEPGTRFDDLPDDFVCPLCGAGKEDFAKAD